MMRYDLIWYLFSVFGFTPAVTGR